MVKICIDSEDLEKELRRWFNSYKKKLPRVLRWIIGFFVTVADEENIIGLIVEKLKRKYGKKR